MTAAAHRTMAGIEAEIGLTRAELGLTLDALTDELAPKHLVEKAVNMVGKSWSSQAAGGIGLGGAIRADAAPLALIGLGVAWLIAENTGLLDNVVPGRGERTTVETAGGGNAGQTGGNGSARDGVGATPDVLHSIAEPASDVTERTGEGVEEAARSGGRACRAGKRMINGFERNPLLFGLAGIVCGAVVAMLAPSSRREQELVAGVREELWKKAEELGRCAATSVRAMAAEPTDTAAEG